MTYIPGSFSAYGLPKKKREERILFGVPLTAFIRTALLLLVAVALLIPAFFPILNCRARHGDDSSYGGYGVYNVRISALDCLIFTADAMQNLTSQEIEDSDLSAEYQHILEDISCILVEGGTTDSMLRREQELNFKLNKVMFRMLLQSEDTVTGLTVLMLAVIALLYIAAAIALLVIAVLALVRLLRKADTSSPSRAYLFMLTAIPCLLCLTLFLVLVSFDTVVPENSANSYTFMGGAVFSLVLSLVTVAALAVLRFIKKKPTVRELVFRLSTVLCSFLIVVLFFSPVLSIHMKAQFPGYEEGVTLDLPLTQAYFNDLYLTEAEMDECNLLAKSTVEETVDKLDSYFNSLKNQHIYTHKMGKCDLTHYSLLKNALAAESAHKFADVFAAIPFFSALAALGALLALQQSLIGLAGGKFGRATALGGQIVSSIFALTALILIAVFMVIINANTYEYMTETYFLNLGFAPILSLVLTAPGYVFCLLGTRTADDEESPAAPATASSGSTISDQDESL